MSGDPEFDDFLRRRRPLFRADVDDGLQPPPELDRIVLRQAREAIESDRPMRPLGMPRWAAPLAIAATLVLGLAIVLRAGLNTVERVPEVRVESVAQRIDYPPPPVVEAPAVQDSGDGAVVVTLAPPAPAGSSVSREARVAAESPVWRRDAKAWQTEIERLRAMGDTAHADAEQAEFNRQFRAMATSPDR